MNLQVSDGGILAIYGGAGLPSSLRALSQRHPGLWSMAWQVDGKLMRGKAVNGTEAFERMLAAACEGSACLVQWGGDPLATATSRLGRLAVAARGGVVNFGEVVASLLDAGHLLRSGRFPEVLLTLLGASRQKTVVNQLVDALWSLRGGFQGVVLSGESLIAGVDPFSLYGLWLGRTQGSVVIGSNPSDLFALHAPVERPLGAGELIIIGESGEDRVLPFGKRSAGGCGMKTLANHGEQGRHLGRSVSEWSSVMGEALHAAAPALGAELVLSASPRGDDLAQSYAHNARLPFRHHRFGQTVDVQVVEGRRVVLVVAHSQSFADGEAHVHRLMEAGAVEVHVRGIAKPKAPCPYRLEWLETDTPSEPQGTVAQTSFLLPAKAFGEILAREVPGGEVCLGCLNGQFPVPPESSDTQLDLFEDGSGQ